MNNELAIGTVVIYSDVANPPQTAIVTTGMGDSGCQKCVFDDDHTSAVSLGRIEGPGGWRLANHPRATPEQVLDAIERGDAHLRRKKVEQEQRFEKQRIAEAAFKAATPAWAKGVIIAELEESQSDIMTDYHGSRTIRTVVLGWSKHSRQLFPEMRKLAATSDIPEVQALADAPATAEHRENYSMGGGTYLKDGSRYSTGWNVSKSSLGYVGFSHFDIDALNKLIGTAEQPGDTTVKQIVNVINNAPIMGDNQEDDMAKDKDDKKPRAKRADLEETDARFAGILRVCELGSHNNAGQLTRGQVETIKKIAEGKTLNEIALAAGWKALGLEVEETAETEVTE